jgi:hypothetical protein
MKQRNYFLKNLICFVTALFSKNYIKSMLTSKNKSNDEEKYFVNGGPGIVF